MKKHTSLLLGLILLVSLIATACTEPQCYREHLRVYTKDYVAICEDGYWKDFCLDQEWCDSYHRYTYDDCEKNDIIPRLDDERCPVIQCIDKSCKCGPMISRAEVGVLQAVDLIDNYVK